MLFNSRLARCALPPNAGLANYAALSHPSTAPAAAAVTGGQRVGAR